MTTNIFHRGWVQEHEENSVAAIRDAIYYGGVEVDIRPTKDDYIVIHHDTTWDRLTPHTGRIIDTPFDKANSYQTHRGYDVPSLHQAVTNSGSRRLLLDCKTGNGWSNLAIDRVGITLNDLGAFGRTFLFSENYTLLERFKARIPKLKTLLRPKPGMDYGTATVRRHDANGVLVPVDTLGPVRMQNFRDAGFFVFVQNYSVNNREDYEKALSFYVDGIIIDSYDFLEYTKEVAEPVEPQPELTDC